MSTRGFGAGNRLRALLIASAIVLSLSGVAYSTDVKLDHTATHNSNSNLLTSQLGHFEFTVVDSGTSGLTGKIQTFCLDSGNYMNDPGWYDLRDDVHNMPTPPPAGGMGPVKAIKINILINEIYGTGNNGSINAYETNGTFVNNVADIQNAIWAIVNGTPGNTLAGYVDSIFLLTGSLASYITSVGGSTGFMFIHGLDGRPVENAYAGQDQIYWSTTPNFLIDVPVPGGAILAGLGICCVGGFNYLRRRKAISA